MKQKLIFYLNLKIRYLTANAAHYNQGARPNRKYGKYLRLLTFRGRTPPPPYGTFCRHFDPIFSFAIKQYLYETDFTLGPP